MKLNLPTIIIGGVVALLAWKAYRKAQDSQATSSSTAGPTNVAAPVTAGWWAYPGLAGGAAA